MGKYLKMIDDCAKSNKSLDEIKHSERRYTWSGDLMCHWISWSIEWDGFLRLDLPEDNCCNMRGAIKAAEAICPMVFRIDVYAGDKLDITYSRANSTAKWESIDRSVRATAKA